MPAQTTMKIRRDTAANWSSANPILAAGEMGYTTDTKILKIGDGVTAWNSLDTTSQEGATGSALSLEPRGLYVDGTKVIATTGSGPNNAVVIPYVANRYVGDTMEWRLDLELPQWIPTSDTYLIAKYVNSTSFSWYMWINTAGYFRFVVYDGTSSVTLSPSVSVQSASGVADGGRLRLRAQYARNTGAGQYSISTSYSTDLSTPLDQITSWTSLFSATGASIGATTDVNTPVTVATLRTSTAPTSVSIYRAMFYSNGTCTLDTNFSSTAANSLAFTATSGIGIRDAGLVLPGILGLYALSPDAAALDITGDIDIIAKVKATDWTPSTTMAIVGKETTSNLSYIVYIGANSLRFQWSANGTSWITDWPSPNLNSQFVDNTTYWIRVTLDVDNSGQYQINYYVEPDSANVPTWSAAKATINGTTGVTSIFSGTGALHVGSSGGTTPFDGTIYRVIVKNGINGTTAFDADFDAQAAGTSSFNESSANAALVTVNNAGDPVVSITTQRYAVGLPNVQWYSVASTAQSANNAWYHPFVVTSPISVDMAVFEVTAAPASNSTMRVGVYAADTNCQPSGAPIVNTATTVTAGSTGVYYVQFTPVTLQPGVYLSTHNISVSFSLRFLRGAAIGMPRAFGANPFVSEYYASQTNASYPTPGTPWNAYTTTATPPLHPILFRWSPL